MSEPKPSRWRALAKVVTMTAAVLQVLVAVLTIASCYFFRPRPVAPFEFSEVSLRLERSAPKEQSNLFDVDLLKLVESVTVERPAAASPQGCELPPPAGDVISGSAIRPQSGLRMLDVTSPPGHLSVRVEPTAQRISIGGSIEKVIATARGRMAVTAGTVEESENKCTGMSWRAPKGVDLTYLAPEQPTSMLAGPRNRPRRIVGVLAQDLSYRPRCHILCEAHANEKLDATALASAIDDLQLGERSLVLAFTKDADRIDLEHAFMQLQVCAEGGANGVCEEPTPLCRLDVRAVLKAMRDLLEHI